MNNTPLLNRLTVSIFGLCNSGKSSLFNAITNTKTSIVSELPGTTTDPVIKTMELLPHGPITVIDTAGTGDATVLGKERLAKTNSILNRTDFAIYTIDLMNHKQEDLDEFKAEFIKRKIPYFIVYTKNDINNYNQSQTITNNNEDSIIVSVMENESIDLLLKRLSDYLDKIGQDEIGVLDDVNVELKHIICVIPIDNETPKKRLILPQVQLIRECLDKNIRCSVTTINTLSDTIADSKRVDLIVTDSQVFKQVCALVPEQIPLTSFSILLANQKGNLKELSAGVRFIENLVDGSKVLIAESCTHNTNHEDIGKVKIPNILKKATGKKLEFVFSSGRDYPKNLSEFSLIIHCGGCMISKKEFENRVLMAKDAVVPITNYGVVLAYCNNMLERSLLML